MDNGMENGYVSIFRKLQEDPIYKNSKLLHVFLDCIISANYKDNEFLFNGKLITIKRGQFITGRHKMSERTNINDSKVYRCLTDLKLLGKIDIKTNNKYTIITVCNYDTYQSWNSKSEQQMNNKRTTTEQQMNNKRTTTEQQMNTNNNDNKENNENNENKKTFPISNSKTDTFDFEKAWNLYPLKLGKKEAEKHFKATVKNESDYNNLIKAIENYNIKITKEKTERKFIKHGSTFFNNWQDYVTFEIKPIRRNNIQEYNDIKTY